MPIDTFKHDLQKAMSLVSTAKRMLRDGRLVDLSALEGHVRKLCEDAAALDAEDRATVKPNMLALMDELDRLHRKLADQHADLQKQLRGLAQTNRAMAAYGRHMK